MRLLAGAAMAALACGAASAEDLALNIQPQPLGDALNEFAVQAKHGVVFAPGLVAQKTSPGVTGAASVDEALAQVLAGTGLTWRRDGATFLIVQAGEGGSGPQSASAGGDVDALIVTAQKREENIQDVPIAISAFSQQALNDQKIEGGFDLLKAIPNVTFSKNNYSGYNFSIRGVGTKAVSATTDPGVDVNFNNSSLLRNRLFEQEYFDVERVEVLRGPQGTLYGRNATSGVVNLISAKPDLSVFEGEIRGEVGSYNTKRLSAMLNVPLVEDVLGVRFAGALTQRDGYGENLATGEDIDGRDLWSGRLSVSFNPTDRIRADLIWERFNEDDNRLRTGKQLCHRDPGPETLEGYGELEQFFRARLSQGCKQGSLYDDGAFGAPMGASIPFVFAGQYVATMGWDAPAMLPHPTIPGASIRNPNANSVTAMSLVDPYDVEQSRDLREIYSMHDAVYKAKADILQLNVEVDLTDSLTLTSQTLYNEDSVYSFQDYNRFATQPTFNDTSNLYTLAHAQNAQTALSPALMTPFLANGVFCDPQIGCADRLSGFEISTSDSKQFVQDLRLQSNFDGPLNFSGGLSYTEFTGINDYYLFFNVVTLLAQGYYNGPPEMNTCNKPNPALQCMYVDTNPVESVDGRGHNYFRNQNPYKLESKAAFGEVYFQVSDTLKLTAGLRYTDDRKKFTPWRSQLLVFGENYGPSDPINQQWGEYSGRLGFDWHPDVGFTDETLLYAFYSRGYKGGGANPPTAVPVSNGAYVVSEIPPTFDPEFVDAFEVGVKNTLLGGSLTLNANAFLYDYKDYQVSKVVDRTIVNENFDARIWGLEFESIWAPSENLRFNATLGYLNTEIAKGEKSIDIFNRTAGRDDWMVVTPWIQQTSNCILPTEVVAQEVSFGIFPDPTNIFFTSIVLACTIYTYGEPYYDFDPLDYPEANNGAGFATDLSGKELPNAPHFTFNIGAQYSWNLLGDWEATLRGDYYRQSDSYARVYNLEPYDRLRGWENANLSLRVEKPDEALRLEVYVKNVFDETPITDAFLNSDSTGMTTNVFVLDPRLIGVSITKGF